MNALLEFEKREPEISREIASTLRALGEQAIAAYASVGLYHNTLSRFVPSILENGLVADSPEAAPDQADVDFATELFEAKGYYYEASKNMFDILIRGKRKDREPGVFFYPHMADATEFKAGYGVPERIHLLAMEMGFVMLQDNGTFDTQERQKARKIFEKYRDVIIGDEDAHIAVVKANPFNPGIINHRLSDFADVSHGKEPAQIARWLRSLGYSEWEGIYVPGPVAPDDLELMDAKLPILVGLDESKLNPNHSRYFYTPSHHRRAQI